MCLDTVTKTGLNKSGYGWKVFSERNGKLYGESQQIRTVRPRNRWLKAIQRRLFAYDYRIPYTSGFHVILERDKHWKRYGLLVKVKYRKGHTLGTQIDSNVIVADEMLILPLQKKGKAQCKKKNNY